MLRPADKPASPPSAHLLYFILLATSILLMLVFFLHLSYRQKDETIRTISENEAHIIANELNATLRRIRATSDLVAHNLIHVFANEPLYPGLDSQVVTHLQWLKKDFPEVLSFNYYDKSGKRIFSSNRDKTPLEISQESYFQEIRESPRQGLMFSAAQATLPMTLVAYQVVFDKQGTFLGLVTSVINLDYYQHFLKEVDVGNQGMVSVRRSDDSRLVFRWPVVLEKLNNKAPNIPPQRRIQEGTTEGVVRYVGATDGVDRIFAFHKISDFPFYVLVGRAYREQFHTWFRMASVTSVLTLAFLALLGLYLHRLRVSDQRLRQSEQYFQAILNSQNDAVCRWLPDTTLTFANTNYIHLFGDSTSDNLIGRKWIAFLGQEEQSATLAYIAKLVQETRPTFREQVFCLPDGSQRTYHWADVPLFDPKGQCLELQSVGRDITDIKHSQLEQEKLQRHLNQAQKMEAIGFLAGGIAHDFNNILAVIIGNTEIVLEDLQGHHAVTQRLNNILQSSQRAVALVKQILAFSRQEQTVCTNFAPQRIVHEALKLIRSTLPSTITIVEEFDRGLYHIHADPIQFHQVVVNLCTNAFHAMEQNGGILTLTLCNRELSAEQLLDSPGVQPGIFVELTIRDTGVGMEQHILSKIFAPYFTTKQVGKGTGMGLAIVHGIVTSTKGTIKCESEPGKGTIFRILLPANEIEEDTPPENGVTLQPGTEHILLVDDEPMLADAGKSILESLGYTVTTYNRSTEALSAFRAQPLGFDMVITDQTMPEMTGVQMARHMLELRPELPIILCTGYSSIIDEEEARQHGIQGFALKPIKVKALAELIRNLLPSSGDQSDPGPQGGA